MSNRLQARLHDSYAVRAESLIDGRSWIQVMPVVEKVRNGPWYQTITAEDLEAYAESIRSQSAENWSIPVDRDHRGDTPGANDTRAAGWFTGRTQVLKAGEMRPDDSRVSAEAPELWAEIKWTPRAIQEIRDGEYRFISPTYDFKQKDSKTGLLTKAKDIIAATLTNRPFFDMAPVMATVVWAPDEGYESLRQKLNDALNADADEDEMLRYWVMDVAEAKALVRETRGADKTWVVPFTRSDEGAVELAPESEWTQAEEEWIETAQTALARFVDQQGVSTSSAHDQGDDDMELKVIASALGLPEDADDKAITDALARVKAEKEQLEEQIADLKEKVEGDDPSEIEKLEARLKAAEGELETTKREQILAKAVEERRIAPAAKEELSKQFEGKLESLKAMLQAMPENTVARSAIGAEGDGGGDNGEGPTKADRERFTAKVDGQEIKPDEESLGVHAKAKAYLAERKIDKPSAEQYLEACEAVRAAA